LAFGAQIAREGVEILNIRKYEFCFDMAPADCGNGSQLRGPDHSGETLYKIFQSADFIWHDRC
jgi:hypothetical protein